MGRTSAGQAGVSGTPGRGKSVEKGSDGTNCSRRVKVVWAGQRPTPGGHREVDARTSRHHRAVLNRSGSFENLSEALRLYPRTAPALTQLRASSALYVCEREGDHPRQESARKWPSVSRGGPAVIQHVMWSHQRLSTWRREKVTQSELKFSGVI